MNKRQRKKRDKGLGKPRFTIEITDVSTISTNNALYRPAIMDYPTLLHGDYDGSAENMEMITDVAKQLGELARDKNLVIKYPKGTGVVAFIDIGREADDGNRTYSISKERNLCFPNVVKLNPTGILKDEQETEEKES